MADFFNGSRRKTGTSTLVLALAFSGIWMRSYAVMDLAGVRTSQNTAHVLVSDPAGMTWIALQDPDGDGLPDSDQYLGQKPEPRGVLSELDIKWKRELCGFAVGIGNEQVNDWGGASGDVHGGEKMLPTTETPFSARFVVVPYWSVILLLTLLSAYFLLSKRPESKANLENKATPEAGGNRAI